MSVISSFVSQIIKKGMWHLVFHCISRYSLSSNGHSCMDIDECTVTSNAGGCAQNCTNTPGSYLCSCNTGYILQPDLRNCVDRNECTSPSGHFCQHTCLNENGGYTCSCFEGIEFSLLFIVCVFVMCGFYLCLCECRNVLDMFILARIAKLTSMVMFVIC